MVGEEQGAEAGGHEGRGSPAEAGSAVVGMSSGEDRGPGRPGRELAPQVELAGVRGAGEKQPRAGASESAAARSGCGGRRGGGTQGASRSRRRRGASWSLAAASAARLEPSSYGDAPPAAAARGSARLLPAPPAAHTHL